MNEGCPQKMIDDLKGWMVRYDFYRPHRQFLGWKTPCEAVCDWHKKERSASIPAARPVRFLISHRTWGNRQAYRQISLED